ncbi:hypothetical protein E2C00_16050 [Streptomyces sp. WAC05374]|uniref:hypothetical protein n=1 Tax=Streptomyces sp. WAC05374 TaxID=2487420 RepID=UPI000F87BA4E|nr:hypothetical protein [Streptomyces sp. WAC05374]RST19442.1 hypothetical protein EF905_01230 [Streptomyces sp. WAC05374]TDF48561.1 hypothetical protein E2B92_06775 [Streptomyces sp. WAC05374]TDF54883.1 hypothetical protein E2C02_15605 [Streptomyces sp. WAC05374]TDF55495.1 hypothetical protein E2C00_16050 [Streptomyces sp. WAC05374]
MRAVRRAAGAVLGLLLLVGGCTAPGPSPVPDTAAFQSAADRRAAVVREAELAGVPLAEWSYRVTEVRRHGDDRAAARAELSYRFAGYDSGPVTGERALGLERRDGRWHVTSDRPAGGAAPQLWEQGAVEVVRGRSSLVLGAGQDIARLRAVAAAADRAVPAVSDAWPDGLWARRVVVLVPGSLERMGALMGEPAAGYKGIAAVTTGRVGGGPDAPADRVIVNPEAYAGLGTFGKGFVLTHETAHVATRAHTSAATGLWLSEGFADWVAYRGTSRTPARAAPELRDAVRAGRTPAALPTDGDFSFASDAAALARAYAGGWLACELIAERWGEAELRAFYRAAGARGWERALREVLGVTPEAFTARWRDYLRDRLG